MDKEFSLTFVEKAIDLDLRIKLINEELVTVSEREVLPT
jgi:hypothetical protein